MFNKMDASQNIPHKMDANLQKRTFLGCFRYRG